MMSQVELPIGNNGMCLDHIIHRLKREHPDLVIVMGDVNSTLACALTAKKLGIAVAHVEAGFRSRDMAMPEEINRLCTDAISDLLFTTDPLADDNLRTEGTNVVVGNRKERILAAAHQTLADPMPHARRPVRWDGHTAERIISVLLVGPAR
jgi:UDP-N-acetylglucosamine 2-epimerase